ncbi:uncharacterized protein LOC112094504, partial [Morus notabilis]|uniref:uncharacterized protein LOC112094504 n=1 Tax=Morus notabilis TaxID=981085 RepID=UPI000CED74DC
IVEGMYFDVIWCLISMNFVIEAESLKEEFVLIQALVKEAEAKLERGDTSNVVKAWLNLMRELGNCIEDVVDDFLQYVEQQRGQKGAMKTLKLHQNMASKITNNIKRIHQMKNRAQTYGLLALSLQGSTPGRDNTVEEDDALRLNSLCIEKDELVAIDATSKELVDKLVKESSNKRMIR